MNGYTRPPLASLACVHPACEYYGQTGQGNLAIRKVYGRDGIRYLRCRVCQTEFSERKGTALWNCKVPEAQAIAVAEHLGEGCSFKGTARLVRVDPGTVRRLCRQFGHQAQQFHDVRARELVVDSLQADERHGFVARRKQQVWEAELIDPSSKFILSHVQGRRNGDLIRALLTDGASRLLNRHSIVLFTDGEPAYASLFPELFGVPFERIRDTHRGRRPNLRFSLPRGLAHVQIIKKHTGRKLESIQVRYRHGSRKRAQDALYRLRHTTPNTAIIERRNATARCMNATQTRRTLAFARHPLSKLALGWWTLNVYNWCRTNRMLKAPLLRPTDRKQYVQRTPAMALGLANHIFTVAELLRTPVFSKRVGDNLM